MIYEMQVHTLAPRVKFTPINPKAHQEPVITSTLKHHSGRISALFLTLLLALAVVVVWLLINYQFFEVPSTPPPHNIESRIQPATQLI